MRNIVIDVRPALSKLNNHKLNFNFTSQETLEDLDKNGDGVVNIEEFISKFKF